MRALLPGGNILHGCPEGSVSSELMPSCLWRLGPRPLLPVDLAKRAKRAGCWHWHRQSFPIRSDSGHNPTSAGPRWRLLLSDDKHQKRSDEDYLGYEDGAIIQRVACERARATMSNPISPSNSVIQEKTKPTQQPNESQLSEKQHVNPYGETTSVNSSEDGGPGLKCYLVRRSWAHGRLAQPAQGLTESRGSSLS
jgi:hypothetical protein